jgi:protein-disulfide isomerase
MTSGKQARRQRQQAARPPVRSTQGRKASPAVLIAAVAGIVILAAVIAGVFALSGGSDSSTPTTGTKLSGAADVEKQFAGIPQSGDVLGKASAPATLVEYIDLQCPVCRQFETEVMPTIIDKYVRTGKLKVISRPVVIIGPDSETGRNGMIAASKQNRAFNFAQILYFNQGPENGGWLDDTTVANAAASIKGVNVGQLQADAGSQAVKDQAATYDSLAQADNLSGTPTLVLGKTGGKLTSLGAGSPTVEQLSAAIDRTLKSQ